MAETTTRTAVIHPHMARSTARRLPKHALAEAEGLARALRLEIVDSATVPMAKRVAGTLIGSGKIDELKARFEAEEVELVIVDAPLSPVQQRNLERVWQVKVLDRTGLILEIFADRAATREGVLQVDLAQLTYQRSRLVRSWTHLERQRGASGTVGGPGETQLESDRRAIDDQIIRIKAQLSKVVKTRALHRAARKKVPYPIVALVGYTNAGKSSIFNRMTGADVLAKDMLFATLDPTMRAIDLPGGRRVILSDTVGFVSELPTQLVAAFRATLEEVLDADLIVHVRDIAHPETEEQAKDVLDILRDLGIDPEQGERMVELWNKVDLLDAEARSALENTAGRNGDTVVMSAMTGQGMDALCDAIDSHLAEVASEETITLGYDAGQRRAWLFSRKLVQDEAQDEDGFTLTVRWTERQKNQFATL